MAFRKGEALFRVIDGLEWAVLCSISPENPAQLFNQKPLHASRLRVVCLLSIYRLVVCAFCLAKHAETTISLPDPYIFI